MQLIAQHFDAVRKMVDDYEKVLTGQIRTIEEKNRQSTGQYRESLLKIQKTVYDHSKAFESIMASNDHIRLMELQNGLTADLDRLKTQIKEVKPPITIDYRLEKIDQLRKNVDDALKQVRVVEQKAGNLLNFDAFLIFESKFG